MQQVDGCARGGDHFRAGQDVRPRLGIHVATNGDYRGDVAERVEDFGIANVASVEDQIGAAEGVERFAAEKAVRIGDQAKVRGFGEVMHGRSRGGCEAVGATSGGLFGLARTAQRTRTWNGKRHMPEIGVFVDELDADIVLAIAGATNVDHAALDGMRSVIVNEEKLLAHGDEMLEREKRAVAIDRLRMRGDHKFFALTGFAVNRQGHG